jgi:hypothetical protein
MKFNGARYGHSEWPSILAPGDKIVPIIAFGGRFIV